MIRMTFRTLLLAALALSCGGCATLMSGMRQKVEVVSDPPGAMAVLDTGQQVRTPGVMRVEKLHPHQVTVSLEGYRPATVPLIRKVQWYVLANIITGIVPGMLIDFLGGGAFGMPKQVKVRLTRLPEQPLAAKTLAEVPAEGTVAPATVVTAPPELAP